jgi:hypothetical protein
MPKFFFKKDDSVLSHCACVNEPANSTLQLDCPWCGCGWLFTCSKCQKAFTFAEVCETDLSLHELSRREATARGLTDVSENEIAEWVQGMSEALDPLKVGDTVVYLDGSYWAVDATHVEFTGYFAQHKLARLPHAEALSEPSLLRTTLGNKDYWLSRERPDRE